jgi:diguanylate cyclase (GGDEF)-like protein
MHPYYPTPWRGIEGDIATLPNNSGSEQRKQQSHARILIADDEPRARASLKELLRFTGHETTLAESGREAIELLSSNNFDLILLDLNMPDLNGHKVMEHIDHHNIDCEVVIISGEATFDHASLALRKGAKDFLRKPYQPEELLRTIDNTLEHRLLKLENKLISQRLNESESLHKFIVNNSPDMIYLLDQEGHFAFINDSLGHYVGDELLKQVGQRLRSELREADTLARVGGDEFNLLIPEINDIQDARNLAEKILRLTAEPFLIKNEEIFISFSIGISVYPSDGDTKDSLIKHADIAMYKVKNSGKNGYAFYSDQMKSHFAASLDIENGLRKAISTNELCLYYQPQYNMKEDKIVGVEALVRWQHPDKGIIQPNEFISVGGPSRTSTSACR